MDTSENKLNKWAMLVTCGHQGHNQCLNQCVNRTKREWESSGVS